MDGYLPLDLDQRRLVDEGFRLRIDSVRRVYIGDGRNRLCLLSLFAVVELDVACDHPRRPVIS